MEEVTESNVSLKKFRRKLVCLPISIRNEHHRLITAESPLFEVKTIEGIFAHTNLHLSFLDFSLLEHIIGHFGSESLKQEMTDYKHQMSQFLQVTTISDIFSFLPQRREHQQERPMERKFDITTTTLARLDEYRKRYASDLLLSDLAILMTKSASQHLDQPLRSSENLTLEGNTTPTPTAYEVHMDSETQNSWQVSPEEVFTTDDNNKVLGRGVWGYFVTGEFQGNPVTIKILHLRILSPDTIKEFNHEIEIMIKLDNPNIVKVIAAALDKKRRPMIVTEPIEITLRTAYDKNCLGANKRRLFKDTSNALIYLHGQKVPIIHGDVSSVTILIFILNNKLLAKLSDYGSAKLARYANTLGNEAIHYTAPEARPRPNNSTQLQPPQTTKIDVYSFGIVMCEVVTRKFSEYWQFSRHLGYVQRIWPQLHPLITSYVRDSPYDRPSMKTVLEKIEQLDGEP